jgi:formylglycine-generating enzyme required for sulfatase activity
MTPAGAGKNSHDGGDPGWDIAWNDSLPLSAAGLTRASCGSFGTFTVNPSVNENRPMNCINWYEAYAFCIWDGGRLPTEAEWNYAAAGGSAQREYPWGATVPEGNANLAVYGCYYASINGGCTGPQNIAPVGSVSAGNGKWGQSDLAGNLWEWAEDWYASPYVDPCNDCSNSTTATHRVVRSGSYSNDASTLPSWFRNHLSPSSSNVYYGGRCARNAQ